MGRLASKQGGSGEAHAPQHCKGIDPRGVLRRFEASSRPLGGRGFLACFPRARFWGGPNRILSEASQLKSQAFKRHPAKRQEPVRRHSVVQTHGGLDININININIYIYIIPTGISLYLYK